MDQHCPECGAPLAPGESCQEFFERLLFEDYADMERNGPVHPQMVASFMLTHDRYSDEARPQAIALLRIALETSAAAALAARAAQLFGWTRRIHPDLRWDRAARYRLADHRARVAAAPDEEYPARINRWARSVLDTLAAQEDDPAGRSAIAGGQFSLVNSRRVSILSPS